MCAALEGGCAALGGGGGWRRRKFRPYLMNSDGNGVLKPVAFVSRVKFAVIAISECTFSVKYTTVKYTDRPVLLMNLHFHLHLNKLPAYTSKFIQGVTLVVGWSVFFFL